MNDENLKVIIGDFLRNKRKKQGLSASYVANESNYTAGHISGIENGYKSVPNEKFIAKYLDALKLSDLLYNQAVEELRTLTEGVISLDKKDLENIYNEYNKNLLVRKDKNNKPVYDEFDFPINDLSFHLKDNYNAKRFENIILDENDKEQIYNLIKQYLLNKALITERNIKEVTEQFNYRLKENDNNFDVINNFKNDLQPLLSSAHNLKTAIQNLNYKED